MSARGFPGRGWVARVPTAMTIAVLLLSAPAAQRQAEFRAGVELTIVEVTVRGDDGQLIIDLGSEAFELTEQGRPLAIQQFSIDPQPVTATLLVHTTCDLDRHRDLAAALVDALEPGDRLSIGSFGTEVVISPILSGDRRILRRILDEELWPGFYGPVVTAVERSVRALPNDAARPGAIVIGASSGSPWNGRESEDGGAARRMARERAVLVFAVATGSGCERIGGPSIWTLQNLGQSHALSGGELIALAKDTGGAYLRLDRTAPEKVPDAWATRLLTQMRVRYVLGFAPAVPGQTDGVRFRLRERSGTVNVIRTRPPARGR